MNGLLTKKKKKKVSKMVMGTWPNSHLINNGVAVLGFFFFFGENAVLRIWPYVLSFIYLFLFGSHTYSHYLVEWGTTPFSLWTFSSTKQLHKIQKKKKEDKEKERSFVSYHKKKKTIKYSSYLPFSFPSSLKSPIQLKRESRLKVRAATLTVCFDTS